MNPSSSKEIGPARATATEAQDNNASNPSYLDTATSRTKSLLTAAMTIASRTTNLTPVAPRLPRSPKGLMS
jgi:hypothetical protein